MDSGDSDSPAAATAKSVEPWPVTAVPEPDANCAEAVTVAAPAATNDAALMGTLALPDASVNAVVCGSTATAALLTAKVTARLLTTAPFWSVTLALT